jgi:hypothetical protein
MMYATIQEAFNEPSFSAKRKKSTMTPLKSQPPQNITNANLPPATDPYDPFYSENIRGDQPAYLSDPSIFSQTPTTSLLLASANNGKYPTGANNNSQASCPQYDASGGGKVRAPATFAKYNDHNNTSYGSQAADYRYYCDNFNICPQVQPLVEGFQASGNTVPPSSLSTSSPSSTPSQSTTSPQQQQQCSPIQAPVYTIPISDETKAQYAAAMNVALADPSPGSSRPYVSSPQKVDMEKVTGMYDDEVDQYMNISTPKTPVVWPPVKEPPSTKDAKSMVAPTSFESADDTPLTKAMSSFEPSKTTNANVSNKNKWQYITDLILFIVAGILVLLLCEMLFRFASLFSIATVDSLRPLLEELADLKVKIAELGKEMKSPSSSSVLAA